MSELRTDSREWVHRIMGSLDRMLVGIENLAVGNRPVLGGERYLTDKEVSAQLKLSRRTLQDYRNEGRISYYQLGGKILYQESDINASGELSGSLQSKPHLVCVYNNSRQTGWNYPPAVGYCFLRQESNISDKNDFCR